MDALVHRSDRGGPAQPLLTATGLRKHFPVKGRGGKSVRAVDGVSFTVRRGETLGIVGESGSGKSTLGRLMLGLHQPTSGSVRFEGVDLARLSAVAMRKLRRHMQPIFQDPYASLNPRFTIAETLAEPLLLHHKATRHNADAKVCELLGQVGLDVELRFRYPHEFSGGQRQRVSIARALA